jgi:hypothetical protein
LVGDILERKEEEKEGNQHIVKKTKIHKLSVK